MRFWRPAGAIEPLRTLAAQLGHTARRPPFSLRAMGRSREARAGCVADSTDVIENAMAEGTRAYFAWLRTILTLSSGSITLLVSLKGQFVPAEPLALWLLKSSWGLLAAAVVLSLLGIRGEHRLHLSAAREVERARMAGQRLVHTPVERLAQRCGSAAPWAFVGAMITLAAFGIANVGGGK